MYSKSLPEKLKVNNNIIIINSDIAETFNNYFSNVGFNLAQKLPNSTKHFSEFLTESFSQMSDQIITVKELKNAFISLKVNKSTGYDEISSNVVKNCFDELNEPLLFIFNQSLTTGTFPDSLKIARVVPIFKTGDKQEMSNYRPISILPCFSKLLERIMYS